MDVPALQKALDAEKRKNHQMQLQVDDYRGFHSRHITDLRDKDQRLGVLNAELASKDHRIRELESDLGKANADIARLEASREVVLNVIERSRAAAGGSW